MRRERPILPYSRLTYLSFIIRLIIFYIFCWKSSICFAIFVAIRLNLCTVPQMDDLLMMKKPVLMLNNFIADVKNLWWLKNILMVDN